MGFIGFQKESLEFLQKIRDNDTKEWFESHRDEYERLIKDPCVDFVIEMGEHLQALVPTIKAKPKVNSSLFRIYRDIRFSKDKTPIKSRIGVIFWQGNTKRMQSSSFYLHFSPNELFFATGIRGFSRETLAAYREYIQEDKHRVNLANILISIKKKGYDVGGLKYKRVPREFDKDISHVELTKYAAMYAYKTMSANKILLDREEFIDMAYKIYEDFLPLQEWVYELTLHVSED